MSWRLLKRVLVRTYGENFHKIQSLYFLTYSKPLLHKGGGGFKVSLYNWQRGANPHILWRSPILPTPSFFQIFSANPTHSPTPLPCHLQPLPPLFFPLSCFCGWMGDSATIDVLFYLMIIMDVHILSIGTLVPEGPFIKHLVFYATRCQVYWGLRHKIFYWYSDLISHTDKHTNTHSTLRGQ